MIDGPIRKITLTYKGQTLKTLSFRQPTQSDPPHPSEVSDAASYQNGETQSIEELADVNQHLRRKRARQAAASFSIRPGTSQFGLSPPQVPHRPNRCERRAAAAAKSIQRQKTVADIGLQLPEADAVECALFGTPDEPLTDNEDNEEKIPKLKKRRLPDFKDVRGNPTARLYKDLEREMEVIAYDAMANRVVFPDFDFMKNCKKKTNDIPQNIVDWFDNQPRTAVSGDGCDMLHFLPGTLKSKAQAQNFQYLKEFAKVVPPPRHRTCVSRGKPKIYKEVPGMITGETQLINGWNGLGQPGLENFGPCAYYVKGTVKEFKAKTKLKAQLRPVFHRINVLLRTLDPVHYQDAMELKRRLMEMDPAFATLAGNDNMVYEGMEILWNVRSALHNDKQDPIFGWAIITILGGPFEGGEMHLPNLGLRVRMQPGDVIFLRGRVLRHVTMDWEGGQRISIPIFTHSSTWKLVKELNDRLHPDDEE